MEYEGLKVDISDLKGTIGASLDIDLEGDPSELGLDVEGVGLVGPTRIQARFTNEGDCIDVKGRLTTGIRLECNRCLKEFTYPLGREFHLDYFKGRPEIHKGELELKEGDFEKVYYRGDQINLLDEIKNEVVLGIPMKPLCQDDCPGLCPVCGQDLGKARCSCQQEGIDPRLAKLKELL